MSASSIRSAIERLNREIAGLRGKVADEARKEADATTKINRAADKARRATNASSRDWAVRDMERAQKDVETATSRRAQHERAIAQKTTDLYRQQTSLAREEDRERKKSEADSKRAEQARERRIRDLETQLAQQPQVVTRRITAATAPMHDAEQEFDCFISHASEDKEGFVRAFAAALAERGVSFFYDEISIEWGDSLRRRIDSALARSSFGVVVLSEAFFAKEWPQRELDGLVQMEMAGKTRILPLWHQVTKDQVASFSPMLADKAALKTADFTVAEIADRIATICGHKAS